MRGLLILILVAAVVIVGMLYTGMLNLSAEGGQLPTVKAQTGGIGIGTTSKSVEVPTVEMKNATMTLPTIELKKAPASPTPAAQ